LGENGFHLMMYVAEGRRAMVPVDVPADVGYFRMVGLDKQNDEGALIPEFSLIPSIDCRKDFEEFLD